jgi:hypothetical protein
MLYLSFDIANRSLAFTLMIYDKQGLATLLPQAKSNLLEIDSAIRSCVNIIACEVHDLTQGIKLKNSSQRKRTLQLKELLRRIDGMISEAGTDKVKVLLEYQMSINKKANVIFSQIYYHFAEYGPVAIRPCYKNMVYLSNELHYSEFSSRYANSYCANKAHSKANFIYFLKSFGFDKFLETIKKKNIDDAADSFMQILAYTNYYSKEFIFKH